MAPRSRPSVRRSATPLSPFRISIVLVGLLGIVAAAAAGHRHGGGHAGRPSQAFFDYLFSAGFVFMTVGAIALMYMVWHDREGLLVGRQVGKRRSARALGLLLLLALLLVASHRTGLRPLSLLQHDSTVHHVAPTTPGATPATPATPPAQAHLRWLPALAVAGLFVALVLLGAVNAARRRVQVEDAREAAEQVAAALDDSVDDLRAEPDPRRAIIAAYARMERALAVVGVVRRPAEAPLEYLARALEGLRASTVSVRRLTELFRIAKFSAHRLGPDHKESAIAALIAVRDELRADELR